ncbi:S-Ena type endospore appendage [Paenibacillus sp. FSL R5-0490]|uniref:DUF3992 domain-containing protein n=2 Tax=Bacillales TaxID=1385 RepID=UPI00268DB8CA
MCSSCNSMCCCCPDENGGNGTAGRPILSEKFCGTFELDCGNQASPDRIVWRSIQNNVLAPVVGTMTITYNGGCADTLVANLLRNGVTVGSLTIPEPEGQGSVPNSKSLTVQNLFDSLEILCLGQGANDCEGQYCLNIHYPSPFNQ